MDKDSGNDKTPRASPPFPTEPYRAVPMCPASKVSEVLETEASAAVVGEIRALNGSRRCANMGRRSNLTWSSS